MSSSSSTDTGTDTGDTVGVQQLIDRLKAEGVQEGQQQAEALLTEAKKQAAGIVEAARAEADTILREAGHEAERTETNGTRALQLASRDATLQLKEQLEHEFRGWIGRLVHAQLDEPEFLADVIREMAADAITVASDGPVRQDGKQPTRLRFLVAEEHSAVKEENSEMKSLDAFVKGQAADMFRQGVRVQADRSVASGFRVHIVGDDIEIDFSDEAVTAALMRFLAPKFRQLIGSSPEDV